MEIWPISCVPAIVKLNQQLPLGQNDVLEKIRESLFQIKKQKRRKDAEEPASLSIRIFPFVHPHLSIVHFFNLKKTLSYFSQNVVFVFYCTVQLTPLSSTGGSF